MNKELLFRRYMEEIPPNVYKLRYTSLPPPPLNFCQVPMHTHKYEYA